MNKPQSFSVRSAFFRLSLLLSLPFWGSAVHAGTEKILSLRDYSGWCGKSGSAALQLDNGRPVLPLTFPGISSFHTRSVQPFLSSAGASSCVFSFKLPEDLPSRTEITIYAIDHDFLWWQTTVPLSPRIVLPLTGPEATRTWQPRGHRRLWNDLVPRHIRELGIQVHPAPDCRKTCRTKAILKDISLWKNSETIPLKILDLSWIPQSPRTGDKLEMRFRLNRLEVSPFDPAQLRIDCIIQQPNGQSRTARCFYFEDFLYHPEERDKTRCLSPCGLPDFRMRFTPLIPGCHRTSFKISSGGVSISYPGPEFTVEQNPAEFPGFIRPDPAHPTFLQYDDGSPFLGLGMNVRSPYDNRYKEVAPYSLWEDRGLEAYEYLFRKYEQCGINVAEVWMSSWWLALEWIPDSPGFHGVGHYNQYRAWMLDHILELAEKHHIHLILVFNNHGKFGMTFDTEWKRNPYNKANGGFLDRCEDYYTSQKAKAAFRNTADYILARWGYSPRILMWKLFTEVDLTGPTISFYHHPSVAAWHREMGDYIHSIDPFRRMITTHWMLGYHRINDAIATLPQLDCLTTDAYYQSGGSKSLVQMLQESNRKAKGWKKPLVITEFGGSSYADNMGNLMKQVELGLWTGLFNEYSVLPMYWWFALVEDKNLYHYYEAVGKFASGEDRREMKTATGSLEPEPGTVLVRNEMRGKDRVLLWFYDRNFFYSSRETLQPQTVKSFKYKLRIPEKTGPLRLEYWNTSSGSIIAREEITPTVQDQEITLVIPSFRRSLAAKIYCR